MKNEKIMTLQSLIGEIEKKDKIIFPLASRWYTGPLGSGRYIKNMLGWTMINEKQIWVCYGDEGSRSANAWGYKLPLHERYENLIVFEATDKIPESIANKIGNLRAQEIFRNKMIVEECKRIEQARNGKIDVLYQLVTSFSHDRHFGYERFRVEENGVPYVGSLEKEKYLEIASLLKPIRALPEG